MKKQMLLNINKANQFLTLMLTGCLLLVAVLGCSMLKLPPRTKLHPGWNLQEACGYLNDVGIDTGGTMTPSGCLGGGFVRSEDTLLHQEKRPGNLGSAIYRVNGKANKADEITFSIMSGPDVNNSNYRAFFDYSQKLFKKLFNKEMPDQMRNDIEKLGKLENDITGKGSLNKPFKYSVDNTEIKITGGYTYKIEIKR